MAQLVRGEPLSPEYLIRSAPTALPFDLRNAAETNGHLVAQRTPPPLTNDGFVGTTEYVMEPFHDLATEESKSRSYLLPGAWASGACSYSSSSASMIASRPTEWRG